MVHSVDTVKLAQKLSAASVEAGLLLDVLLEMNVSGEDAKEGFDATQWRTDAAAKNALFQSVQEIGALPGLNVRGLMTMAPFYDDPEQTRPVFAALRLLREDLSITLNMRLPELSMGMTNDYAVAIEEGATIVRIGRAIFGERE